MPRTGPISIPYSTVICRMHWRAIGRLIISTFIAVVTILARVGMLNDCWDVAAPDKVIDSTQTYLSDWWTGRVMRVVFRS